MDVAIEDAQIGSRETVEVEWSVGGNEISPTKPHRRSRSRSREQEHQQVHDQISHLWSKSFKQEEGERQAEATVLVGGEDASSTLEGLGLGLGAGLGLGLGLGLGQDTEIESMHDDEEQVISFSVSVCHQVVLADSRPALSIPVRAVPDG